ncbi:hypothetical protein L3X38_002049 [Prunus dulcis]|uniref:Uncharacterized protein n=1 Tax=Prunus dulcis TaxID=3755 RepID=A0AAD4ZJL3_PRUDU|nr:hypothetical protein L3X38_002049 [Prunus dulcis]
MEASGTEGEEGCDGAGTTVVSEGKMGAAVSKEAVRSGGVEGDEGRGEGRSGDIHGGDDKSDKGRGKTGGGGSVGEEEGRVWKER